MPTKTLNLSEPQQAALERLIYVARADTGQSRRVASFLLAWWNAEECGGFDLTDLWGVDRAIADDMLTILALLSRRACYPDTFGYGPQFAALVQEWRPVLASKP
jgi:hypothetical protein